MAQSLTEKPSFTSAAGEKRGHGVLPGIIAWSLVVLLIPALVWVRQEASETTTLRSRVDELGSQLSTAESGLAQTKHTLARTRRRLASAVKSRKLLSGSIGRMHKIEVRTNKRIAGLKDQVAALEAAAAEAAAQAAAAAEAAAAAAAAAAAVPPPPLVIPPPPEFDFCFVGSIEGNLICP